MIRKSIKIAFQRLLMFKAYSAINISGLGIAMAVSLAILLFTYYHFSFDNYIPNGENSFRIITRYGDGTYYTNTFAAFDDVLTDYPEVESHTLCYDNHNIEDVFVDDDRIKVDEAVFVNIIGQLNPAELGEVMEQFDVDVDLDTIFQDPQYLAAHTNCLSNHNTVVLSQHFILPSIAYFRVCMSKQF